jgi:hypothetical protein
MPGDALMMGNEKLSTVRTKLRAAFARDRSNPIVALDRRIRKLEKNPKSAEAERRSLRMLRNALAQVVETKPRKKCGPRALSDIQRSGETE